MGNTTHSIDVNAPIQSVYNQWTQFEEFPRFMRDVVEVRQHGPDALSWKVMVGGKEKQWEARIVEQIPDTSIVWESVDGTANRGAITFEPLGTDATRLTVAMEYEPQGLLEKAADLLGLPSGHVEESLKSFRELMENKGTATQGWRGRIENTNLEKAPFDQDIAPEPVAPPLDHVHANDETETHRQTVPATEIQNGEHQAGMVERPNNIDQELSNSPSLGSEAEPAFVETSSTISVPDPSFQTVPVTDLEAGEHEAGMVARASDQEQSAKVEREDIRSDRHKPEIANEHGTTFFEPPQEEIARRAYYLYVARGQAGGQEVNDWIEAKRQLLEENGSEN
jgi:polyketide cyclase/dehydrase/lipid transport protein/DUF2934 family protein